MTNERPTVADDPTAPALTDAEREALRAQLESWFGDPRQAFLVSDLAPVVERILADRLAAQRDELTQQHPFRRAEQLAALLAAERARIAEAKAEALRDAADALDNYADVFPGEHADWLRDRAERLGSAEPAPSEHDFLPVRNHPDDDECTYRADGTDATYCGEPRAWHEHHPRCYQNTGVPDDLPADLCDCRVLRMIEEADRG